MIQNNRVQFNRGRWKRRFLGFEKIIVPVPIFFHAPNIMDGVKQQNTPSGEESPKTSGNRAIFYLSNNAATIKVLLVYCKDHCGKNQSETQWIKEQIKTNFPEYKKLVG